MAGLKFVLFCFFLHIFLILYFIIILIRSNVVAGQLVVALVFHREGGAG